MEFDGHKSRGLMRVFEGTVSVTGSAFKHRACFEGS